MVLRMTRPHKRADSSFLSYRKRVPEDLRAIVGKREVKISLRTRDPVEAKIAHARVTAEVETRWAQLRRGVISVSQKQAVAMAGEIYRELVKAHEDNPGEPGDWKGSLLIDWGFLRPEKNIKVHMMGTVPDESRKMFEKMRLNRHGRIVQDYLDRHGYRVDNESLLRIKKAANEAIMQGREQLLRNAEGDYRPDPEAGRFPELELGNEPAGHGENPVGRSSPLDVFERYAKESKLTPATVKRWRPVVARVQKENPHISGITPEWCIQWKNKLVESGLSNNTIRNGYLASMRSLCNWAVSNKEMSSNPFKDVTVKADKKKKMRQQGFTDAEARAILTATLEPAPDTFSPQHAAARRWVPWLCAYLGARVGEIGQLRGMDIKQEEGVWLAWITPDAGSTKNESARNVALHPHLIDQGFLRFVQKSGAGPLFYDPRRKRKGSEQNPQSKKIGERIAKWVRELGVDESPIDVLIFIRFRH